MNKKGCAKFLGNLKTLIFACFMTGVVNRPPANGNNHPIYIYIYLGIVTYLGCLGALPWPNEDEARC